MHEAIAVVASIAAGVLMSTGVWALGRDDRLSSVSMSIAERAREGMDAGRTGAWRQRFALEIERAGWSENPARISALTFALSGALAALGLGAGLLVDTATSLLLSVVGAVAGVAAVAFALHSAAARRRVRIKRELAPLLELFVLELAGGGSALSALGSVTLQVEGELATELRRLLVASQVSGSATFELRLRDYAETMQIPALAGLATILTASREYGTGVMLGVRALASDLRREQRRELIAHSRRALNHVLFPAAIGVLLPFLAILLFPAVSSLQRNLR